MTLDELKTDRLLIRLAEEKDAEFVRFMRSDPTVNRYINRPASTSLNQAKELILTWLEDFRQNKCIPWHIQLSDKLIGNVSLWNFSTDLRKAELGYALHPDFQGYGYMAEALKSVIYLAFDSLHFEKLEACTHRENASSIGLLKKLNFGLAGKLNDPEHPDYEIYRLFPSEANYFNAEKK